MRYLLLIGVCTAALLAHSGCRSGRVAAQAALYTAAFVPANARRPGPGRYRLFFEKDTAKNDLVSPAYRPGGRTFLRQQRAVFVLHEGVLALDTGNLLKTMDVVQHRFTASAFYDSTRNAWNVWHARGPGRGSIALSVRYPAYGQFSINTRLGAVRRTGGVGLEAHAAYYLSAKMSVDAFSGAGVLSVEGVPVEYGPGIHPVQSLTWTGVQLSHHLGPFSVGYGAGLQRLTYGSVFDSAGIDSVVEKFRVTAVGPSVSVVYEVGPMLTLNGWYGARLYQFGRDAGFRYSHFWPVGVELRTYAYRKIILR